MASSTIDSRVFGVLFASKEMNKIFSDENRTQKWLDTEAALARAQAKLGIITEQRAEQITKFAKAELLNLDEIGEGYKSSITIVPLLRVFKKAFDDDSGEFVHWGATSQDIMDNGLILQIREAHALITKLLTASYAHCIEISEKYKNTVMAGRTHVIHALPITFGFKTAMWAQEIRRSLDRLEEIKPRLFVGQLSGAVGTLASQEGKGLEMQRLMMADLGLNQPVISWHPSRDHIAEYVSVLAIIAGTLGRIAREILSLQRTEICEVEEPFFMGKVGSSTMPHKRNPQVCEGIIAQSRIVRSQAPLAVEVMGCENERDWGCELVEWDCVPKASIHLANALESTNDVLENLIVYPEHMKENLNKLKGAMLSEAVMLHLGEKLGRLSAHEIVYEVCMKAFTDGKPVIDDLLEREEVVKHFTRADLEEIMQPEKYVGLSAEFVDRVVAASKDILG
ncbi:adenylosuccinate lyase [Campylobacter hyointestinalis]|uniref:adenylosuccinate lyase n=1 Tax=Campylobacter hyointestinalis TaxID=198 RepID=UPI0011AC536A|nr:adenylosuccinate lyase [Campylobacter hyointestinalis]TWO18863.1 adenylosuccinate lyase [Campylobacter hyointestinalis]